MKFCQFDNISVIVRVLHATQVEISTTFYGGYIKNGFFFADTSVYSVCNARTNPKEMNTGDRYPAAYIDERPRNSPSHAGIRSVP